MRTVGLLLVLTLMIPGSAVAADGDGFAREKRSMFVMNFSLGMVDMPGFNSYAASLNASVESQGFSVEGYSDPTSVMGAELGFRYYAPYYIFAYLGVGAVVHHQEYNLSISNAGTKNEFWNMTMELPILAGAHYPVHERIHLHVAMGPVVLLIPGSYWDNANVGLPDFDGTTGVGFQMRLGADFYVTQNLAFGLEMVYRNERVEVTETDGAKVKVGNEYVDGYEMDFSGIGMTVGIHFVF